MTCTTVKYDVEKYIILSSYLLQWKENEVVCEVSSAGISSYWKSVVEQGFVWIISQVIPLQSFHIYTLPDTPSIIFNSF